MAERVGFEPTVGYKPTPIFKTGAINQLDHLSIIGYDIRNSIYNNTFYLNMSIVLAKKVGGYLAVPPLECQLRE